MVTSKEHEKAVHMFVEPGRARRRQGERASLSTRLRMPAQPGATAIAVALTFGILGACTPPPPSAPSAEDPALEWARGLATTDFQRDILEDGVVSRAEYEEAFESLVSCMHDAGIELELTDSGSFYSSTSYVQAPGADTAFDRCQSATTAGIAGLYEKSVTNPDGRDFFEILVECLVREGALTEPMAGQELAAAAGFVQDTGSAETGAGTATWTLPFAEDDPRYLACLENPSVGTSPQ